MKIVKVKDPKEKRVHILDFSILENDSLRGSSPIQKVYNYDTFFNRKLPATGFNWFSGLFGSCSRSCGWLIGGFSGTFIKYD